MVCKVCKPHTEQHVTNYFCFKSANLEDFSPGRFDNIRFDNCWQQRTWLNITGHRILQAAKQTVVFVNTELGQ